MPGAWVKPQKYHKIQWHLQEPINNLKNLYTQKGCYTYELSENLNSTPSDGIGPTKKLFDKFLQTFSRIHLLKLHPKCWFNKTLLSNKAMISSKALTRFQVSVTCQVRGE